MIPPYLLLYNMEDKIMKKNQFALIFLTVVTMLAVWYIKSPLEASNNGSNDEPATTARLSAIIDMREALRNERAIEVSNFNQIIASSEASVLEKEAATISLKEISSLTENEVLLEVEIINLGYRDAFVHISDETINVLVVKDTFSYTEALDLITLVDEKYATDDKEVIVTHKSESELI